MTVKYWVRYRAQLKVSDQEQRLIETEIGVERLTCISEFAHVVSVANDIKNILAKKFPADQLTVEVISWQRLEEPLLLAPSYGYRREDGN